MLIYAHLPTEKLYYGVSRNLEEPQHKERRKRVRESIEREGLKNPLSCGNVKDNGTYQVNRGNNCLAALIEMGVKEIPCIVCCKPDQKNNPTGRLVTEDELVELHKSGVSKVYEVDAPQCFAVAPLDVKLFSIGV
jgi:hypothetical protein